MFEIKRLNNLHDSPSYYDFTKKEMDVQVVRHNLEQQVPEDLPCVIAKVNDLTVGIILYKKGFYKIDIWFGTVRPEYRRKGYYRLLFNELVKIAKESNVRRITSCYFVTNEERKAMHHSLGRKVIRKTKDIHYTEYVIEQ